MTSPYDHTVEHFVFADPRYDGYTKFPFICDTLVLTYRDRAEALNWLHEHLGDELRLDKTNQRVNSYWCFGQAVIFTDADDVRAFREAFSIFVMEDRPSPVNKRWLRENATSPWWHERSNLFSYTSLVLTDLADAALFRLKFE